ncbi:haloacid dehalogenase [Amycolatopsis antarctica]|uniref:Haloacid dehalogenase n=1 Tax=Amycolatopsis antarctica TaxID=1854586 RepID=A0A263CYD0_9PSEU|nr:HAD family hydrolase [Amycolatopsis antarctica]OZM70928.1 haloacid dehalogenase [Amycolatopsis antarctica]
MAPKAVLFDFSGTLFRLEQDESWLTELTDTGGDPLDIEAQAELMRKMTAPVGQVVELDEEHRHAWENRDLDPALHAKVYAEVLRQSGVPRVEQAKALYSRLVDPARWTPYPDAEPVLKALSDKGIRVAVVSNIAFDIRPAFSARGLDAYVEKFVLSFEEGVIKPEPGIFRVALEALGVDGPDALMVGDAEEADGGARALGCDFALVEPLPTAERTDGLLAALREHGAL